MEIITISITFSDGLMLLIYMYTAAAGAANMDAPMLVNPRLVPHMNTEITAGMAGT